MSEEEFSGLKPYAAVCCEYHCGREPALSEGIERLCRTYPESLMLGLSAVSIRSPDKRRDMAEELFDGNIASEITLGEAIIRGILKPLKYILSVYSFGKELEKYEKLLNSLKSRDVCNEAAACLETLRRTLENAESPDIIFDKHMTERHGKYIIFTPDYESMQEYMKLAGSWFGKIDRNLHVYSLYSDDPYVSRSFQDFKADDSDHLRLLYCIDTLNGSICSEDISGVILLRSAMSPVIYRQQIGRLLSVSKSREPVIFDIVSNIENLYSVDSIKEEINNAIVYYHSHGGSSIVVNDTFEFIDTLAGCKELFGKLETALTAAWDVMYAAAEKYYKITGSLSPPQKFITEEGYALGSWLETQRRIRSGKVNGILTDEQIEKLDRIDMRWDSGLLGRKFQACKGL